MENNSRPKFSPKIFDKILNLILIFVWLVLRRKVPTLDNLLKRGWSGEESCVFCLNEVETIDHFFMGCDGIKALLVGLLPNKSAVRNCFSATFLWDSSKRKGGTLGEKELATIATTCWVVWLERNRRIFQDSKCSLGVLVFEIRALRKT